MSLVKTITLPEVLHRIKSGERFDLEYVTADRKRGKGGQLRVLTGCLISKLPQHKSEHDHQEPVPSKGKAPAHFHNSTINIQILDTREIRKIHPRLITRFNNIDLT